MIASLDLRPVLFACGALLSILSLAMLLPVIVDLLYGSGSWRIFVSSAAVTFFFGVSLMLTNHHENMTLNLRQTFLMTTLVWLTLPTFASLPLIFAADLRVVDGVFEAVSGLTTTGATVLTNLEGQDKGVLFWRALLQWIGGVGIVVLSIAILPFLRIGGMALFRSESSDKSDKIVPRAADLVLSIGVMYLLMTLITITALALAGVGLFEAICHGLTTIATGGFSTRDASVGGFDSATMEWIIIVGMLAGSLPFVSYIAAVNGNGLVFWRDSQIRHFAMAVVIFVALVIIVRIARSAPEQWHDLIRESTFNVISIMTTTGYASADYGLWGAPLVGIFFVLMWVGGCTGSTTGGLKVFRFEILFTLLRLQLNRLYSPNRLIPVKYNERRIETDILISTATYMFVVFGFLLLISFLLACFGLDFITAISGATSAMMNVGPGLGPMIGPAGTFTDLPDGAKWILALVMVMGRLEFMTVLVLLNPGFWRN